MKTRGIGLLGLGLCLLLPAAAHAHGTAEMVLGSTADGGGDLALEFEFDHAVARVSYDTTIGGISLYSEIIPAIEPLAADEASLFVLDNSTAVTLEVTAIDEGKVSMKIGATTVNSVGDTVAVGTMPFGHTHPTYSLQLALPEGSFGEASIAFRLHSTGPTSYGDSPIYTLRISNGVLPVPDYDTSAYDAKSVKCISTANKQARLFASKVMTYLDGCLTKVQIFAAKSALTSPPANLGALETAAEKACADAAGSSPDSPTLLGKIAAAQAKAAAAIDKDCGAAGSGDYTADDISQFLGLASCRAQELTTAAYGVGREQIEEYAVRASQGGDTLGDHLTCLNLTATE